MSWRDAEDTRVYAGMRAMKKRVWLDLREERARESECRKRQFWCFWMWPWGHVWRAGASECLVCYKQRPEGDVNG